MGLPVPAGPRLPAVTRAALSPVSVTGGALGAGLALLGGAGLVGVVVFAPLGAAVGTGVVLWRAGSRRRPLLRDRIDPFAVGEPWRHHVRGAVQARNRFDEAVRRLPPGPLRDRLGDVRTTVDEGVRECWEVAKRAQSVAEARRRIDADRLRRRLAELTDPGDAPADRADGADGPPADDGPEAATVRALTAQLETATRLDRLLGDTRARLELLEARLAETVSRVVEVGAVATADDDLTRLGSDLGSVVEELEALRAALSETGGDSSG